MSSMLRRFSSRTTTSCTPSRGSRGVSALLTVVPMMMAVLVSFMIASSASADDDEEQERPGSVGVAYVLFLEDTDISLQGANNPEPAHGGALWLAYRFNDWISSMVRAEYLNGFEFNFEGEDVRTKAVLATMGVKIFPLGPLTDAIDDVVEPFIEIGPGFMASETQLNDTGELREYAFAARFAGGVDINVTDSIGLVFSAAYTQPTAELDELTHYSVTSGVQYKF